MGQIDRINVHSHERNVDAYSELQMQHMLENHLEDLTINTVDVYAMKKKKKHFKAGHKERLIIFLDCTPGGEVLENQDGLTFNGVKTNITTILTPISNERFISIKSEEGFTMAQYDTKYNELYVLFNPFELQGERIKLFEYVLKQFNELVWYPKALENSWVHTTDKEKLVQNFEQRIQEQKEEQLEEYSRRLENEQENMEYYKREFKRAYDRFLKIQRRLNNDKDYVKETVDKLIKDIDLVVSLEKVTDVRIENDVFNVFTNDIYAYDLNDNRYYIGKFKIKINMNTSDVRFFNLNNKRKGYWTDEDHHPHVDGSNGRACLGNVDVTIAELSSQNEFYALVLTCIDFLENANTQDPAGAKIIHWDMVDEDGDIIQEGYSPEEERFVVCDWCEEETHEDEMYGEAFTSVDSDGNLEGGVFICENCRGDEFYYSDVFDEAIHRDIDDMEYVEEEF